MLASIAQRVCHRKREHRGKSLSGNNARICTRTSTDTQERTSKSVSSVVVRDEGIKSNKKRLEFSERGVYAEVDAWPERVRNSLSRQISRQATEQVTMMHQGVVNLSLVSAFQDR